MQTCDQRPVDILNYLVGVNNDRIEAYIHASRQTDVKILKTLFSRLSETSEICRQELCAEVFKLGGKPERAIVASSEFFKTWLDLMKSIGENNHRQILQNCVKEESIVISTYESAMYEDDEIITTHQFNLFTRQHDLFLEDQQKVKNLLGVLNG